ncbi:MAG: hypothetical protein HYY37_06645 [Candidatus Aenigmarchaeota archaeon]|nr:hypothetical protein [Candidatus Aenigmarchaeota archaeon]
MLVLVLSILDAVTAFVLWSHVSWGWFSPEVVMYHALYTILKGALFALNDFASKLDIISGVYILLVAFGIFSNKIVTVLVVVWLVQKAFIGFARPLFRLFG